MAAGKVTTHQKIVGSLPDMVFTLSRDGRYTGFVPGGPTGPVVPPDQFLGRRVDDVLGSELAAKVRFHIERVLDTGVAATFEYWLASDRGNRLFEARVIPSSDGVDEVVAVVRDVTDGRPGGRELAELHGLLVQARDALELAAPYLPRDSEADLRAATALAFLYKAEPLPAPTDA